MDNTKLFSKKAGVYHSARSGFPQEMMEYIFNNFVKTNDVIADIGSGTGKFTEMILQKNNLVYAIEPNDDMRCVAEKTLSNNLHFISVNATAENTCLLQQSVDVISVARAFHWFDKTNFLSECKRILKPKGRVLVITSCDDRKDELFIAQDAVLRKICPKYIERHPTINQNFENNLNGFFANVLTKCWTIENYRTKIQFIDELLSKSYAPSKEDDNYFDFIDAFSNVFNKFNVDGKVCQKKYIYLYTGDLI